MKKILVTFLIATISTVSLMPLISFATTSSDAAAQGAAQSAQNYQNDTSHTASPSNSTTNSGGATEAQSMGVTSNDTTDTTQSAKTVGVGTQTVKTNSPNDILCKGYFDQFTGHCLMVFFFSIMQTVGNFVLDVVSWVLWLSGVVFNLSIVTMVVHMKDAIDKISAIYVIWQRLRDFVNMFFIFILLFIAIQTILDAGFNYKKMLRDVVLVALFINFSFFATGAAIDVSNTVALLFYNGFYSTKCVSTGQTGAASIADGCMSYTIVQSLKLSTIYATPSQGQMSASEYDPGQSTETFEGIAKFLITVIAGSILMIIIAGVFFASAILIFYRFVTLIMLLMLSPIAFASMILPSTQKHWKSWWSKLSDQLIFAPVYFMFLWIVMSIITSGALSGAFNVSGSADGFAKAFNGNAAGLFGLIANYIIVIILLGYSLVLAKEAGAGGTEMATKAAKGFQGFVGRNTVGRAASRVANSQRMKKFVAASPTFGRLAQKPFDSLAKQSFGGKKGGFEQAEKDAIKDRETQAKRMGPSVLMTEKAKDSKKLADDERKDAHNNADAKIKQTEESFKVQETALDTKQADVEKQFAAAETEAKSAQEKSDHEKFMSRQSGQTTPESVAAAKASEDAKTKLETLRAEKERIEKQKKDLGDQKGVALAKAKEEATNQKRAANARYLENMKEHDRVIGVDKKEAETRAINAGNAEGSPEFKAFVDKEMKEHPGIAKERQEKYAANNEHDYRTLGGAKLGVLGKMINLATNRTSRIAESVNIRKKVIKEKSEEDQLAELAKKVAKKELEESKEGKEGGEKKKDTKTSEETGEQKTP